MVLNSVTKFQKILIKTICLRERTLLGVTYGQMYRCTNRGNTDVLAGVTLYQFMSQPLSWWGHKNYLVGRVIG